MNRFAAYFTAGYLPSLAATYYNQLELVDMLAECGHDELERFVRKEKERFGEMGFAEASDMRIQRLTELSKELWHDPGPVPETPKDMFGWLNGISTGVRTRLNAKNEAHQPLMMAHAAGNNLGEIACCMNLLQYVIRYLMVADVPALITQWESLEDSLSELKTKMSDTLGYAAMPTAIRDISEPVSAVLADILELPIRSNDEPYLILLGRYVQTEYFNLLDALEFAEDLMEGKIVAPV